MTVSDSVEQPKPQDGAKDDGKKPVEVKDEDLVRPFSHSSNSISVFLSP